MLFIGYLPPNYRLEFIDVLLLLLTMQKGIISIKYLHSNSSSFLTHIIWTEVWQTAHGLGFVTGLSEQYNF